MNGSAAVGQRPAARAATYARFAAARVLRGSLCAGFRPRATAAFARRLDTTLAGNGEVHSVRRLRVAPRQGWVDTGITVGEGQHVTVLADGHVYASRALDVAVPPGSGLWLRIGDEPIQSLQSTTLTLTSRTGGALRMRAAEPGVFADTSGAVDKSVKRLRLHGGYDVAIIAWTAEPEPGLAAAAAADPDLFGIANDNHLSPSGPPIGWTYHPRLGDATIFTERPANSGTEIRCHTHADVGIIRYPVDCELTAGLELAWSWNVERLPSTLPEHTIPTHDYLSVAVEFDDGRDLTWLWSSSLPISYAFACPLTWWRERETHLVLRTGTPGLGHWHHEQRPILHDVQIAGISPTPARVVAVWLIANSLMARSTGTVAYRDIRLHQDGATIPVTMPTTPPVSGKADR